jgi:hypothetical protein
MNKLLFGLILVSFNAFAVGNYEVAEKQYEMCKMMGEVAVQGYKARKNGFDRATVSSKEVADKYGPEVQEAMLNGYDANTQSDTRIKQIGFAKCMDKYAKLRH